MVLMTWNRKCTAVASGYVMTSGVHYAEFKTTELPDTDPEGFAYIGIVRPMPGLDAGSYDEFREQYYTLTFARKDQMTGMAAYMHVNMTDEV